MNKQLYYRFTKPKKEALPTIEEYKEVFEAVKKREQLFNKLESSIYGYNDGRYKNSIDSEIIYHIVDDLISNGYIDLDKFEHLYVRK